MKATFTVTVEGNWTHNGKPVTAAIVEREVREALKNEFEYRSSSVTVKRVKTERVPTQQAAPASSGFANGEHTAQCADWKPVTGYGQVQEGDQLRFKVGDKDFHERAKLIMHPGTDKEEVVYDIGRNFYFITSMVIVGRSSHKGVEFQSQSSAKGGDA